MSAQEEQILVVPASVIEAIGDLEGFETDVEKFLAPILASDKLSFQPRGPMESDPNYKQLIPYVLLQWTDPTGAPHLFTYTRGGGSAETRLHSLRSVGIGGHISAEDAAGGGDPYTRGMLRELDEEVQLASPYTDFREGLLYDPSNDVGRVHLGVVHRFVLQQPEVRSKESELADGRFVCVDELKDAADELETWSRLAIEALY